MRQELLEISCLKDNTVRIYPDMVYKYTDFAKQFLHIDPLTSKTWHIHKWMYHLKTKDKGYNFLKDVKVALRRFFAFAVKAGYLTVDQVKTFFNHIDSGTYLGIRDYCIYALMYNLQLR